MTKALATIGTGPLAPVLALSGPAMQALADWHGYEYVVGDGDSQGRPPAWGKVPLLRRLLDEHDTVLWIDADALVLDASRDPLDELPADAFQGLVRHQLPDDWRGLFGNPGDDMPNSGVWLLRGDRGRAFLDAVWAREEYVTHGWWENAAVMDLLGYPTSGLMRQTRQTEWSDGTCWLPGEWNSHVMLDGLAPARIRHYAGVDNRSRARGMRADLGERHVPAPGRRAYWDLRVRGWLPPKAGARQVRRLLG